MNHAIQTHSNQCGNGDVVQPLHPLKSVDSRNQHYHTPNQAGQPEGESYSPIVHQSTERSGTSCSLNTEPTHLTDKDGQAQQQRRTLVAKGLCTAHTGGKTKIRALHTYQDHQRTANGEAKEAGKKNISKCHGCGKQTPYHQHRNTNHRSYPNEGNTVPSLSLVSRNPA